MSQSLPLKTPVYFIRAKADEGQDVLAKKACALIKQSKIFSDISKDDFIGIKLHFGEKDNTGFINPRVVKDIGKLCKARSRSTCLIETNTIYRGARSDTISHLNLAYSHGFNYKNVELPIIISDGLTGRNFVSIKIDKTHTKEAKIASDIIDFQYILSLAHITGHCQTGLGGSIKNIGMGCASRAGKLWQHSTVLPEVAQNKCTGCSLCTKWCPANAITLHNKKAVISKKKCIGCGECTVACRREAIGIEWNESVHNLQEKMAEYAYAALGNKKKGFLNFLIKMTKDCDCMAKDDPRIQPDIGILASKDPIAIDRATIDLLIKEAGCDRLKEGYPNIDWNIQLEHGSKIGLGNLDYELHTIKENL